MHPELIKSIKEHGVVWAPKGQEFVLASGATSKFFIDFSRVAMVPQGISTIVSAVHRSLFNLSFDAIGGPSNGADPIIGALMLRYYSARAGVRGFTIRKEPKGRGPNAGELFEGYLVSGLKVAIIEDVTTSGQSVLKAIKIVEAKGAKVVKVVSLLDRQSGASELLKDYDFTSIVKLDDLELGSPT